MSYKSLGKAVDLSVPTPEHYLPLLYTLALKDDNDAVNFFNDKLVYGSIAMTSVKIG
jgi:4,5-DOPA dioxygenase extradiol